MKSRLLIAAAVVALLVAAAAAWRSGLLRTTPLEGPVAAVEPAVARPAGYVGSDACAECHAKESAAWAKSQHKAAMELPTASTMLGNFDDASYTKDGVTSRFTRRGDDWFVRTDGPDGKLTDYRVEYTFGVYPLQQYLVDIGRGRMQALSVAWDSRPADEGGQRWFHLYPGERIDHRDELHWTPINLSMVMGLAPVVGIPLPLLSYGGSALLVIMAAFGLVQSAHVHRLR